MVKALPQRLQYPSIDRAIRETIVEHIVALKAVASGEKVKGGLLSDAQAEFLRKFMKDLHSYAEASSGEKLEFDGGLMAIPTKTVSNALEALIKKKGDAA